MAFLRIHCEYCGGQWEVYHRDNWKDDRARTCPHCYHKIDRQTWDKQVLPAFGMVQDANAELVKDSSGYKAPLFSFDVIADHLFQNRQPQRDSTGASCPLMDIMSEYGDLEGDNL